MFTGLCQGAIVGVLEVLSAYGRLGGPEMRLGSTLAVTCAPGKSRFSRSKRGQAMVEYAVIAGMLVASLAILVVFLFSFKEYGGRILDLAGSEYP